MSARMAVAIETPIRIIDGTAAVTTPVDTRLLQTELATRDTA